MSDNDTTIYHCCLCGKQSEDASLYNHTLYKTPMCNRCVEDGYRYGWD